MNHIMKIITAYLQGGLGNQSFIYAAARALALRSDAKLMLDVSSFLDDKVYHRAFALEPYQLMDNSYRLLDAPLRTRLFRRVRYVFLRNHMSRIGNYCCDRRPFKYRPLPVQWRGNLVLDGYWQSEKYFYDYRNQILADFSLRDADWIVHDPIAQKILASRNSIFLHVRSYKDIPGKEDGSRALKNILYYRNALAYLKGVLANGTVFVFSDDVEWARANIVKEDPVFKFVYADASSTQLRDFMLMRLCAHGIAANSSYSWWANWLGEQDHGGVRIRLGKRVMNDDFWPERWIPISREG